MREASEVNRSCARRLVGGLLACLVLACGGGREEARRTSRDDAPPPATSSAPASTASELYVNADGTVEPAGAMDELIALACGDGPVPDDLEIVFADEPSTPSIVGTHVPHGLYAGNRVVRVLHERGNLHGGFDDELLARTPGRSHRAWFRVTVHGSFSESARRKLWCATARDMASVPPLSPDCRATEVPVRTAVRVRTGGREWRRRIRGAAHCPWGILSATERRFRRMVVEPSFVPVVFLELPSRVASDCSLPAGDVSANVVIGPDARTTDITLDRAVVSEEVARCVAEVAGRVDVSEWMRAVETAGFTLSKVEVAPYWRDGRPLTPPRGPR